MFDESGPLLELAQRLSSPRPPSLARLLGLFAGTDAYKGFVAMVREILPECEQEILRQADSVAQIQTFISRFEDRYFPLEEGFCDMLGEQEQGEDYWFLMRGIPVRVMGVSFDDYHEMPYSYRFGYQFMTYLLEDPYAEDGGGTRVALAEACRQHVPVALLLRVPEGGLSFSDAHELLNGTPYEALAQWGDILAKNTDNDFLNLDYDWLCECEPPDWDRELVDALTQQWLEAGLIHNSIFRLVEWLEEEPASHFKELLDFIERKNRDEPDPRQGILPLVLADEP